MENSQYVLKMNPNNLIHRNSCKMTAQSPFVVAYIDSTLECLWSVKTTRSICSLYQPRAQGQQAPICFL